MASDINWQKYLDRDRAKLKSDIYRGLNELSLYPILTMTLDFENMVNQKLDNLEKSLNLH